MCSRCYRPCLIHVVSHPDSGDDYSVLLHYGSVCPNDCALNRANHARWPRTLHFVFGSVMLLARCTTPSSLLRSHVTTIQDWSMHILQTAQGSFLAYRLFASSLTKLNFLCIALRLTCCCGYLCFYGVRSFRNLVFAPLTCPLLRVFASRSDFELPFRFLNLRNLVSTTPLPLLSIKRVYTH